MIEQASEMDIINVAWLSDNGPLGNFVSSFCNATKFNDAQPFAAPNDIVKKCPKMDLYTSENVFNKKNKLNRLKSYHKLLKIIGVESALLNPLQTN